MTEEMNEAPFKAVDMSQFKRTYLDIPYADAHEREKLDLVLPDEGEGPSPCSLSCTAAHGSSASSARTTSRRFSRRPRRAMRSQASGIV